MLDSKPQIGTFRKPTCLFCGGRGISFYKGLIDKLYGAPGVWSSLRCPDCGFVWLDPCPAREDIHLAYKSYFTHQAQTDSYSKARSIYRALRRVYLSRRFGYADPALSPIHQFLGCFLGLIPQIRAYFDVSVMWLSAIPMGKLLEIGCGRGDLLIYLKELGWDVEGVEFDSVAANNARQRGLTIHLDSLETYAAEDQSFDAIVLSHVIEHLYNPDEVINRCWRLLKRGGKLVVLTPNIDSLEHLLCGRNWFHLDPPRHIHLFNMRSLSGMAKKAGFENVSCFTHIRDAHATWSRSLANGTGIRQENKLLFAVLKFVGLILANIEWLVIQFFPRRGGEMTLIARK